MNLYIRLISRASDGVSSFGVRFEEAFADRSAADLRLLKVILVYYITVLRLFEECRLMKLMIRYCKLYACMQVVNLLVIVFREG